MSRRLFDHDNEILPLDSTILKYPAGEIMVSQTFSNKNWYRFRQTHSETWGFCSRYLSDDCILGLNFLEKSGILPDFEISCVLHSRTNVSWIITWIIQIIIVQAFIHICDYSKWCPVETWFDIWLLWELRNNLSLIFSVRFFSWITSSSNTVARHLTLWAVFSCNEWYAAIHFSCIGLHIVVRLFDCSERRGNVVVNKKITVSRSLTLALEVCLDYRVYLCSTD